MQSSEVINYLNITTKNLKNWNYEKIKNLMLFCIFNSLFISLKYIIKLNYSFFTIYIINKVLFIKIIRYYAWIIMNALNMYIFMLYSYLIEI